MGPPELPPLTWSDCVGNYATGAMAGFSLEAAVHGARTVLARHSQLQAGHGFGSLPLKWWLRTLSSSAAAGARSKGRYQGAVGTLAAGSIWSGLFGATYVPVRQAVEAVHQQHMHSEAQPHTAVHEQEQEQEQHCQQQQQQHLTGEQLLAHLAAPCRTAERGHGQEDGSEEDYMHWGPFFAAAAASISASTVRVPKQQVHARVESGQYFCSLQAFEMVVRREGPSALYRGWGASLVKNMPFDAALFVSYEGIKHMHTSLEGRDVRLWEASAIGAVSGAIAGVLTAPLEAANKLLSIPAAETVIPLPPTAAAAARSAAAHTLVIDMAADGTSVTGSKGLRQRLSAVAASLRSHGGSLRTRLWWCMFEGAVFFPSLEGSIRAYEFMFVEEKEAHEDHPAHAHASGPWKYHWPH